MLRGNSSARPHAGLLCALSDVVAFAGRDSPIRGDHSVCHPRNPRRRSASAALVPGPEGRSEKSWALRVQNRALLVLGLGMRTLDHPSRPRRGRLPAAEGRESSVPAVTFWTSRFLWGGVRASDHLSRAVPASLACECPARSYAGAVDRSAGKWPLPTVHDRCCELGSSGDGGLLAASGARVGR